MKCQIDFFFCDLVSPVIDNDNMIESGIINPAKSDRLALENAISVLNLYLSSSCLIVNEDIQF